MYDSILIPTDGSDGSHSAVETGIRLADRFDADVHALFVLDERYVLDEFDIPVEAAERDAEDALDRAGEIAATADVAIEKHLRRGVPHEEILAAIDDYDVDLVVMGTHGRTGLDRIVHLGSVTERVIRAAPVQVTTVPTGGREA
ncbi:universal stress protein [Halopenitus persicus]|uniref:universal stress protein n=1 Tax=Halopenitus persicus TaxID=1048396 RepID=UPI000BBABF01|nr:universal stress protein [Halopenitus persicus]